MTYDGEGTYFLDKVRPGLWRLEVYPDAVPVQDPFEPPSADKIVTRAIHRSWPMTVALPDLGDTFTVQPVTAGNRRIERAVGGRAAVAPGVYVLSAAGAVDQATLPAHMGHLRFAEYHAPLADTLPPAAVLLGPRAIPAGRDAQLHARLVHGAAPDSSVLFIRRRADPSYRGYRMRMVRGYDYAATIPAAELREGPHEVVVTVFHGRSSVSFPGGAAQAPTGWNYSDRSAWPVDVTGPRTPLRLFDAAFDAESLAFSRIGDAGRRGLFQLGLSEDTGRPVFHVALPADDSGRGPNGLHRFIGDREPSAGPAGDHRTGGVAAASAAWSGGPAGPACHPDGGRRHQLERPGDGRQ